MDWSETELTEPERRAHSIYVSMGPLDGHKHILQLQYFCDSKPFEILKKYWTEVEVEYLELMYPKNEKKYKDST
tara:strand:- start:1187 stop:1408 length:222 start_codon:yes stop_codon:yes gene_type:complete